MSVYTTAPKGTTPPKLTLGNIADGGMPLRGKMRMFRFGQRKLSSYEYDTLDVSKFKSRASGGNKHIRVNEIERFFDRAGKGRSGATVTDPRMSTGAVVFIPLDQDDEMPRRYYTRPYTNDTISGIEGGYRTWGAQSAEQESIALQFKLTQLDSDKDAYFDNSRFMVSNILWEFSPDGGRGRWYQLYELPNQKVRITLPDATQQVRLRAISNNPDEWVQAITLTPRTDFQNRYAEMLHWVLTGESDVADEYIEFDDFGYLTWPTAKGGHGDVIYTLYWTPTDDFSDAVFMGKTKMTDLAPGEFALPVHYLGGWVHIFAQDILSTLHIKMRFTKSIADCEVICEQPDRVYTGYEIKPNITVRFKLDLSILPPEFYDIEYVDNVDVGQATVIVTGKDYYYGTPDEPGHFNITPASVNNCAVTLNPSSYVYNGSANKPTVTVKLGTFTCKTADYTVTYSNNVNAGTAYVNLTGKHNLKDSRSIPFTIEKAALARIVLNPTTAVYAETWSLPSWTVYDVNNRVVPTDSLNVSFSPSEIENVGTYAATAIATGDNYKGTVAADFTLTRASILNCTIEDVPDQPYTGSDVKPKPKVTRYELARDGTMQTRTLVEGVDFYYTWRDNSTVGVARVIVTGMGNYEGCESFAGTTWGELCETLTWNDVKAENWRHWVGNGEGRTEKIFNIFNAFADSEVICEPATATYTGSLIMPNVTVRSASTEEVLAPRYYSASYTNNVNAGTANVNVIGNDIYRGILHVSGTFTILPASLSSCTVTLSQTGYSYDGTAHEPSVTVTLGTFTVPSSSYDVQYSNNVNAGTATVKVIGKNNLTGEKSLTFAIGKASLANITLAYDNAVYAEQWALPGYLVYDANGTQLAASEYTVSISPDSIDNVGVYTFSATGRGNHSGNASAVFTLTRAELSNVVIASIADQLITGSEIKPEPDVTRTETLIDGSVGTRRLTKDVDFNYSYSNNVNAGTATVIVTGINNYEGTASASFKIKLRDLTNLVITPTGGTYGSTWSLPTSKVYGTDNVLLDTSNYSITANPSSITNAGTYRITATGKNLYQGSLSASFTLNKANLSSAEIASVPAKMYTGDAIEPKPAVTRSETAQGGGSITKSLVEGTDFNYSWSDNVNIGTATVTATGIGNYTGSKSRGFSIVNALGNGTWGYVATITWDDADNYVWGQLCGEDY